MPAPVSYVINPGWRILLRDLGISPANVLRRARLPGNLFARDGASLNTEEYFRLWRGIEEESGDPTLPIRIGRTMSVEAFDPPIFAALCSPDLNTALARIALYKKLICPMALHVERDAGKTTLKIEWLDATATPPSSLVGVELVFFVQLARLATRAEIRPLRLTTPQPPTPPRAFADYFGVTVQRGTAHSITFSAADARRPFLTSNDKIWRFFEPELRKRLSELDETATITDRVRGLLLELLPSGQASLNVVATRLGVSTRTLQRQLNSEKVAFQSVLSKTREQLARHYLKSPRISGAEISFLLGYEDPNSFFRAFHGWTGRSPERARLLMRAEG